MSKSSHEYATSRFVIWLIVLSLSVSLFIILAWVFGITRFLSVIPGFITVKFNTAFSLSCIAVGMLALLNGKNKHAHWIAYGCGAIVIVFSGSVVLEYLFNWQSGLDELFVHDVSRAIFTATPGTMAITTACCLFLMGSALILRDVRKTGMVIDIVLLAAMLIALLGMMSTEYETDMMFGVIKSSRMSQITVFLVFTECIALIMVRPSLGFMRVMASHSAVGYASRFLLPASFVIPITTAWLHISGERAGLYSTYNGVVFIAFLNSAIFILLVIGGGQWLAGSSERLRRREFLFTTLMEHSADGIFLVSPSGEISFASTSAHKLLGSAAEKLIGRNFFDMLHPDDLVKIRARLMQLVAAPELIVTEVFRCTQHDGGWIWLEAVLRNLLLEPAVNAIVINYRDITKRKADSDALAASEHLQRLVFENIDDVIIQVPMNDATRIRGVAKFLNNKIEQRLGYTIKEFDLDPSLWPSLVHPDDFPKVIGTNKRVFEERAALTHSFRLRDRSGEYHWVEDRVTPQFDSAHNVVGLFVVSRDITDRMHAEEQAQTAQQRYKEIYENSIEGIFQTSPDGKFISCNPAIAHIYGAASPEDLMARVTNINKQLFVDPDKRIEFQALIDSEGLVRGFEYEARRLDGSTTWVLENSRGVRDGKGNILYYEGVVQDIGERKSSEAALRQSNATLGALITTSPAAIFALDENRLVTFWNPAAERVYGWRADEVKGRRNPTVPSDHAEESRMLFAQNMEGNVTEGFETERQKKSGERITISLSTAPLLDKEGNISGMVAIVDDITKRKHADNQVRQSLHEKEVLIKEIHHRVKNNMQVISSLLNLQSASIVSTQDREIFLESQNRIRSMALVHELLYRSQNFAKIDLANYARELVETLRGSLIFDIKRISVSFDMESILLDVDDAIPIGLCVNELLTNAMKHAFPGGRCGTITIIVKAIDHERYSITVADDGAGFTPPQDIRMSATLGLQLISMLTDQIGGVLAIESGEGTKISITAKR